MLYLLFVALLMSFIWTLKRLLAPLRWNVGCYLFRLLMVFLENIQLIFVVQIFALIIAAVEKGSIDELYYYSYCFIGLVIFWLISPWLVNWSYDKLHVALWKKITNESLSAYLELDNTLVERYGIGRINTIITQATKSWCPLLIVHFVKLIVLFFTISYTFVLIAHKVPHFWYFFGFFLLFCFSAWFFWQAFKVRKTYVGEAKSVWIERDRWLMRFLMSKFDIVQNNNFWKEIAIREQQYLREKKIYLRWSAKKIFYENLSFSFMDGVRVFLFMVVGVGVISGNYELAYFVLLLEVVRIVVSSLELILRTIKDIPEELVHVEKLRDFLDSAKKKDYESWLSFDYQRGNFEVKNLFFRYEEGKSVFENFSCSFQSGKKTALVGPSGGGKTTLVKLLAGYIYPDQGAVLVDGQDLAKVKLSEYYRHIGYLSQEPNVFDGTIKENLLYGLSDEQQQDKTLLEKRIEKIISSSRCEFIYEMEKGLNTEIGERGVRLSWGQKQRLAIAKIMLKDPQIVFLDEPTSALDSISEQAISEALNNLFVGKTVVVVAHRLQTVRNADEILFIQEGEIRERGTHQELKKEKGKYAEMLELQTSF